LWKENEIAGPHNLLEVRDIAEEQNACAQVPLATERFGTGSIGSVADHDHPAGNDARDSFENLQDIHHAFHRTEVRHVAEQLVIRGAEQLTERHAVALKPFRI